MQSVLTEQMILLGFRGQGKKTYQIVYAIFIMIKHIISGVPPCICFNTSLTDSANILFASLLPSVLHLRCDINDHNSVNLYT